MSISKSVKLYITAKNNLVQHLKVPSINISSTCVHNTRRFDVHEKMIIPDSWSFIKHIFSDFDVSIVILSKAVCTSSLELGRV